MSFAPPLLEVQNGGWCSNSPDDSPQTGARLARTEQSDEALPGFTQILGLAGQGFALGEGMLFSSQYLSSKINQKTYLMMGFKRDPLKICSIPISLNWYTLSWCWAESSQAAMSLKPLRRFPRRSLHSCQVLKRSCKKRRQWKKENYISQHSCRRRVSNWKSFLLIGSDDGRACSKWKYNMFLSREYKFWTQTAKRALSMQWVVTPFTKGLRLRMERAGM